MARGGRMSDYHPDFEEQSSSELEEDLEEPRMFKVLLHNDDYTTMEFVVEVLQRIFLKSFAEATQIMLNVHRSGLGVCGIYTGEVAETKVAMVHHMARESGFPLQCSMEEA
jgi:ATP-dependent Clp protease adaptor protein ClpS